MDRWPIQRVGRLAFRLINQASRRPTTDRFNAARRKDVSALPARIRPPPLETGSGGGGGGGGVFYLNKTNHHHTAARAEVEFAADLEKLNLLSITEQDKCRQILQNIPEPQAQNFCDKLAGALRARGRGNIPGQIKSALGWLLQMSRRPGEPMLYADLEMQHRNRSVKQVEKELLSAPLQGEKLQVQLTAARALSARLKGLK